MVELIVIVTVIALILCLILIIALSATFNRDRHESIDEYESFKFGEAGEKLVAKNLERIVNQYGGYLYNNFCFEDKNGFSSEIDHILITRGGVFVIETKTNKGKIYGNTKDEYWTCVKESYQENKRLKNPLIQNQGHINHLKRMLKPYPPKIISMVIFPIANVSSIDSHFVFTLESACSYIIRLTKESKKTDDFVKRMNDKIKYVENNYSISKEKHLQNIRNYWN